MKKIVCYVKTVSRLLWSVIVFSFCINIFQNNHLNAMFTAKRLPSYRKTPTIQKSSTSYVPMQVAKTLNRRLLVFLDDEEIGTMGPIGSDLLTALYEETSPIIVSSSLMGTVLARRKSDVRSTETIMDQLFLAEDSSEKSRTKIENEMRKRNEMVKQSTNVIEDNAIVVCREAFNPDQWVIKKINNHLLLLIPHTYCISIGVHVDKVKEDGHLKDQLSDTELLLGFKVNHFQTIKDTQISISLRSHISSYISILANYFIPFLHDIFCSRVDYLETKFYPEWTIYMSGHGMINESIAYLSLKDFTQLLMFFNKTIRTKLLYVVSCYVAGTNINQVHQDAKMENYQCCSFPIIVQGFGNAVTTGVIMHVNTNAWIDEKKLELSSGRSFQGFFALVENEEKYEEIAIVLQNFFRDIGAIPQIKLPYLEWSSIVDVFNKIASIGVILVKTRDPNKPLKINSFFGKKYWKNRGQGYKENKKYLQTLLLYTDNVPFELIINGGYLENIIPMKTGGIRAEDSQATEIYRIKKISSTTYDLFTILRFFKSLDLFNGQKCVFIDEVEDIDKEIAKNVLIDGERSTGMNAYYTKDGVSYKFNIHAKEPMEIISDSYDDFHYNKGLMRYLIFHKKQSDKQGIKAEDIKKIKSTLERPIHKKVLESRGKEKELEEKRKMRERTVTE